MTVTGHAGIGTCLHGCLHIHACQNWIKTAKYIIFTEPFCRQISVSCSTSRPLWNNSIIITIIHTTLSRLPQVKEGTLNILAYIRLPLTKALPYIRARHLVCIDETMQSTSVCQWKFWSVTASRMQERLPLFSVTVPACAGKGLNGMERGREKRKANQIWWVLTSELATRS